jgi:hypothetical protein
MPTVVTDDAVSLNYLDEGTGPAVVLIAGFCAPATTWMLQQKALVRAGYGVTVPPMHRHTERRWSGTDAISRTS